MLHWTPLDVSLPPGGLLPVRGGDLWTEWQTLLKTLHYLAVDKNKTERKTRLVFRHNNFNNFQELLSNRKANVYSQISRIGWGLCLRVKSTCTLFFFKKKMEDVSPFCGVTDTPDWTSGDVSSGLQIPFLALVTLYFFSEILATTGGTSVNVCNCNISCYKLLLELLDIYRYMIMCLFTRSHRWHHLRNKENIDTCLIQFFFWKRGVVLITADKEDSMCINIITKARIIVSRKNLKEDKLLIFQFKKKEEEKHLLQILKMMMLGESNVNCVKTICV